MRVAGDSNFHDALAEEWGEEVSPANDKLDSFLHLYELLISKGYSESYAEEVAIGMLEGREPMAKETTRFARIHKDTPSSVRFCGSLNTES
tara:strand:- start:2560 stop:2832 length:273 start_codon:yes stop_codon:yes gene_type:complete